MQKQKKRKPLPLKLRLKEQYQDILTRGKPENDLLYIPTKLLIEQCCNNLNLSQYVSYTATTMLYKIPHWTSSRLVLAASLIYMAAPKRSITQVRLAKELAVSDMSIRNGIKKVKMLI